MVQSARVEDDLRPRWLPQHAINNIRVFHSSFIRQCFHEIPFMITAYPEVHLWNQRRMSSMFERTRSEVAFHPCVPFAEHLRVAAAHVLWNATSETPTTRLRTRQLFGTIHGMYPSSNLSLHARTPVAHVGRFSVQRCPSANNQMRPGQPVYTKEVMHRAQIEAQGPRPGHYLLLQGIGLCDSLVQKSCGPTKLK